MPLPDWLYSVLPSSIVNKHLAEQKTHPNYERAMMALTKGENEIAARKLKTLMTAKYIGPLLKLQIQTELPDILAGLGRFKEAESVALSNPAIGTGLKHQGSTVSWLLARVKIAKGDIAAATEHLAHGAKNASCFETPETTYLAGYRYVAHLLEFVDDPDQTQDAISKLIRDLEGTAQFDYHEPCLRHLQVAAAYKAQRYEEVLQLEPRIRELAKVDAETGGQWSEPLEKAQMMIFNSKVAEGKASLSDLVGEEEEDELVEQRDQ